MIKIKIVAKKHVNSLDLGGGGISYNAIRSAILENEKTMKIDAKSNRQKGEVYIPISLIGGRGISYDDIRSAILKTGK